MKKCNFPPFDEFMKKGGNVYHNEDGEIKSIMAVKGTSTSHIVADHGAWFCGKITIIDRRIDTCTADSYIRLVEWLNKNELKEGKVNDMANSGGL